MKNIKFSSWCKILLNLMTPSLFIMYNCINVPFMHPYKSIGKKSKPQQHSLLLFKWEIGLNKLWKLQKKKLNKERRNQLFNLCKIYKNMWMRLFFLCLISIYLIHILFIYAAFFSSFMVCIYVYLFVYIILDDKKCLAKILQKKKQNNKLYQHQTRHQKNKLNKSQDRLSSSKNKIDYTLYQRIPFSFK